VETIMGGRAPGIFAVLLTLAALQIAGSVGCGRDARSVRVFAAASLTEVIEELVQRFEGARVETSIGGSGELARQIRDGAPADVFVSASPEWIEYLEEADLLAGEPLLLARNRLVCIAPSGSPLEARDAKALLAQLGDDARVAIADEGVPAGEYARSALRKLGLLEAFGPRLVGQRDVRAVLHAVEQGELQLGFVYSTDARLADVKRLFAFDPATHPPIEYRAAVVREGSNAAGAQRFLDYLQGEAARTLLADAGFIAP
jgi:molybdate transport system substrate-binding protein